MNLLLLRVTNQYLREIAKFFLCSGKQRESQLERAVIVAMLGGLSTRFRDRALAHSGFRTTYRKSGFD